MSIRFIAPPLIGLPVLLALALLAGCTGMSPHVSASYAQTMDSATSGCLRNPDCYNTRPGEEAVIP